MPKKPAMLALQNYKNQIFLKFDFCFVAPPELTGHSAVINV
jgi:hypothetical protein